MASGGLGGLVAGDDHRRMNTLTTEQIKLGQRHIWASGHYERIAELIAQGAEQLVALADIHPDEAVLDVATGTGNAALLAAARGARVTGLDLTPELFEIARARAARQDAHIDLVVGDAEDLPFPDGSFDVVLSAFGVQYAPRRETAVAELVRVCRSGGRIALANWTPDSAAGRYIDLINDSFGLSHEALSPTAWGAPEEVRRLFGIHGLVVETSVERIHWEFASVDDCVAFFEQNFGCAVTARQALSPDRWTTLRGDIGLLFSGLNRSRDGRLVLEHDYLLALVKRWRQ
jgi:SAM-dependent methyltransferase